MLGSSYSPGLLARYAPQQSLKRIRLRLPKVNPRQLVQEEWELRHPPAFAQDNGNNWALPTDELLQECSDLYVLPRAHATASDKNSSRLHFADLLFKLILPRATGRELFFVEPRAYSV